jgi:O-antigen/teichoic acid export membrane protein
MKFVLQNILNLVGSFFLGVINLVIGILLARYLLPEGVGQYQVIVSTVTLVVALLTMGVGQASIYYLNNLKYDAKLIVSMVFKFALIVSVLTILVLFVLLRFPAYFGKLSKPLIIICSLQGVGFVLFELLYPVLVAFMQIKRYVIIRLLPRFIILILTVIFIGMSNLNLWNSLFFVTFGHIVAALILVYFLKDYIFNGPRIDSKVFGSMFVYGLKVNLNSIMVIMCGEIGILLLRLLSRDDFAEVGYYSRAIRFGAILLLVSSSFGPLLFSKWSSIDFEHRLRQAELVNRFFSTFCLIAVGVVIIFAKQIILLLYGADFLPAVVMLQILIVGIAARFLLVPIFQIFFSSGYPSLTGINLMLNLLTMFVCMLILVPKYKGLGAAISFTAGNLAGLVLGTLIGHIKYGVRIQRSLFVTVSDMSYLAKSLLSKNYIS